MSMTSLIFIVYSLHLTCTEIAMYLSISMTHIYTSLLHHPTYIHTYTFILQLLHLVIYHQSSLPAHQSHIPTCTEITHPYTCIHTYIHIYCNCYHNLVIYHQSSLPALQSHIPTCTAI